MDIPLRVLNILIAVFLFWPISGFALDWKSLHEEADKRDMGEVMAIVAANPRSTDSLYILGLAYLNQHKDTDAGEIFGRIISLNPDTYEAKWGLAEVLRRQHRMGEAEAMLEEIINDHRQFSPAYISLAYIKYIKMDFNASVRLAAIVISQGRNKVDSSNYTRAYLLYAGGKGIIAHYGGLLSKMINGTPVLSNLKKAQSLQKESAGVLFGLGSFYLLAPGFAGGNIGLAEDYLKKAIVADPLFADSYVRLAQLYLVKGDKEKYEELLEKALRIDPRNELALDIKSGVCKFVCPQK